MPAKPIRELIIRVDTREQLPYTFESVKKPEVPFRVVRDTLPEGDYAEEVPMTLPKKERAVVERKSLADLYASMTSHRFRFEAEFNRLRWYGYAALVVEADLSAIMNPNEHLRRETAACPKSILASILAWCQRYNVHFWPCPNRNFAEQLTYRILERWARDHT